MHAMIKPESHLDHGVEMIALEAILSADHDNIMATLKEGKVWKQSYTLFVLETYYGIHPSWLSNLKCGLYGPLMGDAPIQEDAVVYRTRGPRPNPSRMVKAPLRPASQLSIIVGLHNDQPTLFTAFGGPIAPREPLPDADPNSEEAVFWRDHALAIG